MADTDITDVGILLGGVTELSAQLTAVNAEHDRLVAKRTRLFVALRRAGVPWRTIAQAAGITDASVIRAVRRAER